MSYSQNDFFDDLSDGTLSDVMEVLASSSEDEEQPVPVPETDPVDISISSQMGEIGSPDHDQDFVTMSDTNVYDRPPSSSTFHQAVSI